MRIILSVLTLVVIFVAGEQQARAQGVLACLAMSSQIQTAAAAVNSGKKPCSGRGSDTCCIATGYNAVGANASVSFKSPNIADCQSRVESMVLACRASPAYRQYTGAGR